MRVLDFLFLGLILMCLSEHTKAKEYTPPKIYYDGEVKRYRYMPDIQPRYDAQHNAPDRCFTHQVLICNKTYCYCLTK